MNKHYIRTLNGNIVKGFSDAFETPNDTDVCINESGRRHFEINGVVNSPLFKENGCPMFKYIDGDILELTPEEVEIWEIENIIIEPDLDAELISAIESSTTLEELKSALVGGVGKAKVKAKR